MLLWKKAFAKSLNVNIFFYTRPNTINVSINAAQVHTVFLKYSSFSMSGAGIQMNNLFLTPNPAKKVVKNLEACLKVVS